MSETVQEVEFTQCHLDHRLTGYYRELIIINKTNRSIGVIHIDGTCEIVVPSVASTMVAPCVEIYYRHVNGPRSSKTVDKHELPIDGKKIIIQECEIDNGPVYVPSVALLICTEMQIGHVTHPYGDKAYNRILKEAITEAVKADGAFTVRIFANDPESRRKSIVWHFLGEVMEIPVTNFRANNAEVQFIFSSGGKLIGVKTIPFEDLIDNNGYIEYTSGFVLHISDDKHKLELGMMALTKRNQGSSEYADKLIAHERATHKAEIEQINSVHAIEVDKMKLEIDSQKNTIAAQRLELERYKAMIEQWQAFYSVRDSENKAKASDVSLATHQLGLEKTAMATKTEELKMWSSGVKIAATILIPIITFLIGSWAHKAKSIVDLAMLFMA